MAQPVADQKNQETSNGGKTQIHRPQRDENPATPKAHEMAEDKAEEAEAKIQKQSPEASK